MTDCQGGRSQIEGLSDEVARKVGAIWNEGPIMDALMQAYDLGYQDAKTDAEHVHTWSLIPATRLPDDSIATHRCSTCGDFGWNVQPNSPQEVLTGWDEQGNGLYF